MLLHAIIFCARWCFFVDRHLKCYVNTVNGYVKTSQLILSVKDNQIVCQKWHISTLIVLEVSRHGVAYTGFSASTNVEWLSE